VHLEILLIDYDKLRQNIRESMKQTVFTLLNSSVWSVALSIIRKTNWQCKFKISIWHCQLGLPFSGIAKIYYIKTRPNVKFSLHLKKAGLASRNIVHLQKNHPTLCRFLLLYSSFYMWSRLDHYWSNVHRQDHRSGCLLKHLIASFFGVLWP